MKIRIACLLVVCCVLVCAAVAQDDPAASLRKEHWNGAVFAGGGTGLSDRTNVQFFRAGGRIGRVMTGTHAGGTFEIDAEVTPVDYVLWSGYKNVYSFGFNPLVMKWNFVGNSPRKVVPFIEAAGGMLFSADNVPPGDTSKINFISGGGVGMHLFVRNGRAVTFDVRATHLSNASLGNHNPGVNASIQFSLGYTWFRK